MCGAERNHDNQGLSAITIIKALLITMIQGRMVAGSVLRVPVASSLYRLRGLPALNPGHFSG